MVSLSLDPKIEQKLAQAAGQTISRYLGELIAEHLEDIKIAEERLARGEPTLTSDEMRKRLGLEH